MSRPEPVTREISPCKDCTERFTACHGNCPKDKRGEPGYLSWRKALDEINAERKKYNQRPFVRYNPFDY